MNFSVPKDLDAELDRLAGRYPQKRSAALMCLHAIQERFGYIPPEAMEYTARKLELQPINIFELVTFYPMFRPKPAGRFVFKICRTLSCALNKSHEVHRRLCERLGLDPNKHGIQTTSDGRFSVEFVECLASCHTAPVLMCNDELHENMSVEKAEALLEQLRNENTNKMPKAGN
jgi:NADH-quinone oxidoreductase subunit E